jgi:type II secretory pathway pseudopilin PulG
MVAVAISGFLAAILGASLASTISTTNKAENESSAQLVAQEILERLRRTPFTNLESCLNTTKTVQVYSDDGNLPNGSQPFQVNEANGSSLPLLMDVANYSWSQPVLSNRFIGPSSSGYATASVSFSPAYGSTTAVLATVTVTWLELSSQKSISASTVISQYGVHE